MGTTKPRQRDKKPVERVFDKVINLTITGWEIDKAWIPGRSSGNYAVLQLEKEGTIVTLFDHRPKVVGAVKVFKYAHLANKQAAYEKLRDIVGGRSRLTINRSIEQRTFSCNLHLYTDGAKAEMEMTPEWLIHHCSSHED